MLCTVDGSGQRVQSARVAQNEPAAFSAYFQRLPAPSESGLGSLLEFGLVARFVERDTERGLGRVGSSWEDADHRRGPDQDRPARCREARHVVASPQVRRHSFAALVGG